MPCIVMYTNMEVPKETGLSGDGVTEIRSGLSPEDWVVVDAY